MRQLAVYGKGGIGKSTILANLTASLAGLGQRVLQIGCDPKHDSTRLLLGGNCPATVLDYIRVVKPSDYRLEDVLAVGYAGIGCIEAGGPVPGVGCAGRGIITAFKLLDDFQARQAYDVVCYDVLGDVVCGGFAVPIRREYADEIYIVTSGEYMSLYAANNILRGVANYDGDNARVAGLVFNSREVVGEQARVARFAAAVGLPVLLRLPRHDGFARAEQAQRTVVELAVDGGGTDDDQGGQAADQALAAVFADLAARVLAGVGLHQALPLADDELERVVLGLGGTGGPVGLAATPVTAQPAPPKSVRQIRAEDGVFAPGSLTGPNRYLSLNVLHDEPLHGCAFNGAISMAVHLRDVAVLAHSPTSCAFISHQTITSTGRRRLFERGALLPVNIVPNLSTTAMGEADMVFGGMERLRAKVAEVKATGPAAVVVVSSCPAGIIGDDIDQVADLGDARTPVVTIKADGNAAGDYLQGMLMAYTQLAEAIIDPGSPPAADTVNIVGEKVIATNTAANFRTVEALLGRLGIGVHCRFLCETSYDKLRSFTSAPLNLLATSDYTSRTLQAFFSERYGSRFLGRGLPIGLGQTAAWLREVAAVFGRAGLAEQVIAEQRGDHQAGVARLRPYLKGKRLLVITYNHEVDWVIEAARDVGVEIVKVCVLPYSQDEGFRSELGGVTVEENYDYARRADDVARIRPDILLTNYESASYGQVGLADTIPMCPDVGWRTGVDLMARWAGLLRQNLEGEWHDDAMHARSRA